jgi:hypothetical protein
LTLLIGFPLYGFLLTLVLVWGLRLINLEVLDAVELILPESLLPYTSLILTLTVVIGLMALWGGRWVAALRDWLHPTVQQVSGRATADGAALMNLLFTLVPSRSSKTSRRYRIRVEDIQFWMDEYQRDHVLQGETYTYFYLPRSRMILSVRKSASKTYIPTVQQSVPGTFTQQSADCLMAFLNRQEQSILRERVQKEPIDHTSRTFPLMAEAVFAALRNTPGSMDCFPKGFDNPDFRERYEMLASVLKVVKERMQK